MEKQVLFIHGGGEDGYQADMALFDSLSGELGKGFTFHFPHMPSDEQAGDFGWVDKIGEELERPGLSAPATVLVGHSLGASMLLKFLSERKLAVNIAGVFLLAAPFWKGEQDWVQGLKLNSGFERSLPKQVPFYFYHCADDQEVPFSDLAVYRKHLSWADFVELEKGGHQFEGVLARVAHDIRKLFG